MSDSLAIKVDSVTKRYLLGGTKPKHDSLRGVITDSFKSVFRKRENVGAEPGEFWALNGVSFDIRHGENVGVLGLNGAGKSTLFKVLSRITRPTSGRVQLEGRLGALLEVGTGFHGDLTGRENVFLYGAILGMPSREIASKFDAIVDFAGIEKFIDTPVKRYSSGMYVRLAFAVAAHLDPDILLLDEVLAVGDLPFQRKCLEFTRKLQKRDATILLVSHNMHSIKSMCDRVVYLERGRVKFDGAKDQGIAIYEDDCQANMFGPKSQAHAPMQIKGVTLMNANGGETGLYDFGERMRIRIEYDAKTPLRDPNFIVVFTRADGIPCCNLSTEADGIGTGTIDREGAIEVMTPPLKLTSARYVISVLVRAKGFQELLCEHVGATFHIRHELYDDHFGVFHEAGEWSQHTSAVGGRSSRAASDR
jgi:lipopolysaccharide transport system ATP-binding protein